jgi:hypothetical protein
VNVRRLASGKSVAVHSNQGLRKRCACGRRRWTGCDHDWHFSFKWAGTHHRMTLETATGTRIKAKADALAAADALRAAIRAGTFQRPTAAPAPAPPVGAPGELTFRAYADTWLERARDGKVVNAPSERSYIGRLCVVALGDGETLGERAIGRITEDDIESAMEAVRARGLSASSRNHYLQAVQSL